MHTLISLFVLSCCFLVVLVIASKAACKDPYYGKCYGIPLACPPGCPKLCEIECKACKPYCGMSLSPLTRINVRISQSIQPSILDFEIPTY